MTPQTQKTEVNTKIPRSKLFTGLNAPWGREDSHIDNQLIETLPLSYECGDKLAAYWSGLGQEHIKSTGFTQVVVLTDYINKRLEINKIDSWTNRLENFIAEQIFTISDVEYVFFSMEKNSINIWTVFDTLNREVRKSIYDVEYNILDLFKDYHFDFHVICRDNRNIDELYPSKGKIIFQR